MRDGLATEFETHRARLRQLAYRMLGSPSDADDAVQETWLRLTHADTDAIENLPGWLRTVASRICLDMLRSRDARREDLVGHQIPEDKPADQPGPEEDAVLLDSVGRALLVVLDRLDPTERVAFVLHDIFAIPFADIAPVVDRTPSTTKKLASRARHRVRGTPTASTQTLNQQRQVISAFLAAARAGDLAAILTVLAPDVVRYADPAALPPGAAAEVRGAHDVAEGTVLLAGRAQEAELALVNGTVGLLVAPRGQLQFALTFTIEANKITRYDVIADSERIRQLALAVLD
ncbi:MAG: sigma-70 family RNA polymerase sigma factor [Nocardioidaceae bacterium]